MEKPKSKADPKKPNSPRSETMKPFGTQFNDKAILLRDGAVGGWIALDLGSETQPGEGTNKKTPETAQPVDAVIDEELGA